MESAPSPSFGVLGDRQTRLPAVCSKIMALAGPLSLPFRLTALYVWSVIIAVVWWEGGKERLDHSSCATHGGNRSGGRLMRGVKSSVF